MFVAVVCDLGSKDANHPIHRLLVQYGLKKVLENLYESAAMGEGQLLRLKRELDQQTDSYDMMRFYQYPMDNTLVISSLKEKKWRKLTIRA